MIFCIADGKRLRREANNNENQTQDARKATLMSERCWRHIHTYIHTYIHSYVHIYVQTYIHTFIHTYIHTYIHTHIHSYIHTFIHSYIHTFIHTYIHTYIHIDLRRGFRVAPKNALAATKRLGRYRLGKSSFRKIPKTTPTNCRESQAKTTTATRTATT